MRNFAQYVHDTFDSHNATPERFIHVVKAVREVTGMSLKDTVSFCNQYRTRPDGSCIERVDIGALKKYIIDNRKAPKEAFQSRDQLLQRLEAAKTHFRNQQAQIRLLQEKLDKALAQNLVLRLANHSLQEKVDAYETDIVADLKPYAQA